jgi:hypothetical protein
LRVAIDVVVVHSVCSSSLLHFLHELAKSNCVWCAQNDRLWLSWGNRM